MPYLLVATVLVGGGYMGDFRVIAQEPNLESCLEAKKELLALPPARENYVVCIRGSAVWSVK